MAKINTFPPDAEITGLEKILSTNTDLTTKNIVVDTLKRYVLDNFDTVKESYQGVVPLISQGDAEAGTATGIESWSALRVAQAIAALAPGGAGTVDTFGTPVALDFARFTDADTIEGRSYAEVRTDLGLVIGTDVQAYDANNATASSTTTFTNKTFDANGVGNSITNIETADIAAASKSGLDPTIVTGTAGGNNFLAMWNTDGDLIASGTVVTALLDGGGTPQDYARWVDSNTLEGRTYSEVRTDLGLVIGTNVQAYDATNATAASTTTFTNKTIDADGTGNVITNIGSSEIKSEMITGLTTVTGVSGDFMIISDTSDAGNLKKIDLSDVLGGGGGAPYPDTTSIVEGSVDATKELRFEVDGLTTATTRVITMPDFDVDLGGLTTSNVAAGSKSGLDTTFITGTAGANGRIASWNTDGDAVDSGLNVGQVVTGTSTDTFTNKTLDADGTGNVITNIGSSEIKSEMITGFATVTGVAGDFVLISDTSDSGNLKKVDVNDFLGGAGAPFADSTSIVEGSVDNTKELRFEVDGLTTATTRVITMPDFDVDLGALDATNLADEAVTLAKMAHIATDSFLGRDTAATGDVEVLSAATARGILNVEDGATADQTGAEINALLTGADSIDDANIADDTISASKLSMTNATLGAPEDGYVATYDNASGGVTWEAGGGGGNVSNTGTPVDNQLAIWTNATTIEGDAELTYDGTVLQLSRTFGTTPQKALNLFATDMADAGTAQWWTMTLGKSAALNDAAEFSYVTSGFNQTGVKVFSLGFFNNQILELIYTGSTEELKTNAAKLAVPKDGANQWHKLVIGKPTYDIGAIGTLGTQVFVDATDSTDANPSVFGVSNMNSGTETGRIEFGDAWNSLTSTYNHGMVARSYHPMYFYGGRSNITPFTNAATDYPSDANLAYKFLITGDKSFVIETDTASPTNDLLELKNSSSTNVFAVDYQGNLVLSGTVDGIDLATDAVVKNAANTYTAGNKQTFGASGTTAGFAWAGVTANPSSPAEGDMWYRSDLDDLYLRTTSASELIITGPNSATLTNKTLTDAVNSVSTPATDSVGYLGVPQNSQSVAYTLVLADAGKHILHPSADTTARTWTIPANSSVAFPIGTSVTFINQNGAGTLTIAITTDTMRLAGTGATGNRTLTANGTATATKITSTEWIISGVNLT